MANRLENIKATVEDLRQSQDVESIKVELNAQIDKCSLELNEIIKKEINVNGQKSSKESEIRDKTKEKNKYAEVNISDVGEEEYLSNYDYMMRTALDASIKTLQQEVGELNLELEQLSKDKINLINAITYCREQLEDVIDIEPEEITNNELEIDEDIEFKEKEIETIETVEEVQPEKSETEKPQKINNDKKIANITTYRDQLQSLVSKNEAFQSVTDDELAEYKRMISKCNIIIRNLEDGKALGEFSIPNNGIEEKALANIEKTSIFSKIKNFVKFIVSSDVREQAAKEKKETQFLTEVARIGNTSTAHELVYSENPRVRPMREVTWETIEPKPKEEKQQRPITIEKKETSKTDEKSQESNDVIINSAEKISKEEEITEEPKSWEEQYTEFKKLTRNGRALTEDRKNEFMFFSKYGQNITTIVEYRDQLQFQVTRSEKHDTLTPEQLEEHKRMIAKCNIVAKSLSEGKSFDEIAIPDNGIANSVEDNSFLGRMKKIVNREAREEALHLKKETQFIKLLAQTRNMPYATEYVYGDRKKASQHAMYVVTWETLEPKSKNSQTQSSFRDSIHVNIDTKEIVDRTTSADTKAVDEKTNDDMEL